MKFSQRAHISNLDYRNPSKAAQLGKPEPQDWIMDKIVTG
jgi:hypothetical protein